MTTLAYKLNNRKQSAVTKLVDQDDGIDTVSLNEEQKEKEMKMMGEMLKDVAIQHPSSKRSRVGEGQRGKRKLFVF